MPPAGAQRPVYCEFCDYALVGLLEPGQTVTCPECGENCVGRWLPRRARTALAVLAAVSPMLLLIAKAVLSPVLVMTGIARLTLLMSSFHAVLGLAGLVVPPFAAMWLWRQSGRRRVDMIDIACLVPVAWILNILPILKGVFALM